MFNPSTERFWYTCIHQTKDKYFVFNIYIQFMCASELTCFLYIFNSYIKYYIKFWLNEYSISVLFKRLTSVFNCINSIRNIMALFYMLFYTAMLRQSTLCNELSFWNYHYISDFGLGQQWIWVKHGFRGQQTIITLFLVRFSLMLKC